MATSFGETLSSHQETSVSSLCAHQIFEAQVERNPTAVAIVCQGEQVSYQELNQQANRLAHYLRSCGVGPETIVALLAERSIPFAIAILAIFKAGGAYLPLDPQHPEARLRRVIEQSRCQFILSTETFAPTLARTLHECPAEVCPRCITLEEALRASQQNENLPAVSTPGNLAYVIYTSGSTGQPKGAMVEQRGMLNHLYAKIEALELSAADTVAQTASQCFDISVWQFLAVLLVGGRVQIYPDVIAHDALRLLQLVELQQVSILETVPSLLRAMLDAQEDKTSEQPQLETLRWLIPTGEALPVELCRRWLQRYPHIPMLNAYGPTECSDDVTHYVISEPPPPHQRSIPIGRAIRNIRLYVLDEHLQQLPVGESGELYVGGIGVGRGYLGDELRTAEAFITDPFVPEESARLYKTGDLARYLPDGNLEFIGRRDTQVKIRGYRIELGEIEAILNQLEGVREAAVVVREEEPGDKRLVAYVVLRKGQAITTEEVRKQLKKLVPIYMVPATFVLLEKLPLTNNGKLDRAALPAPQSDRRVAEESYVAPTLPLHRQLVEIWEEVLGVKPIGIKDDFFELGGDSLLAVKLFERIEQVCGKKLELATLFAGATIEQVARAFGKEIQMDTPAPLVVVQAEGSRRPFFFLHGQWTGSALYSLELARHLGTEQPFYLLEPYKFDGLAVPPTLEGMAAAHIATLRQVQPEGPYLLGGWCNGGLIAYEMARQLHAQGQNVDLLVLMDSDAPAPRFKWDRRIISGLVNLLRLGQSKQLDWFLVWRHLRMAFHYWRLHKTERMQAAKQDEPRHEAGLAEDAPLHEAIIPTSAVLRQDWISIYDWIAAGYMPHSYAGKVTFFWTDEEPQRRKGWQRLIEAHVIVEQKVDSHIIPGNHITSRTKYLPILAEHLRTYLDKVQSAQPG
jgi:amino acid adenylation domain-containing protein